MFVVKNRRMSDTVSSDRRQDEEGPYPTNPSLLGRGNLSIRAAAPSGL